MIVRRRPEVTPEQEATDAKRVLAISRAQYPPSMPANVEILPDIMPLAPLVSDGSKASVLLLLGAVGFVLLIACANVANLLLTRALARQGELAVRTDLAPTLKESGRGATSARGRVRGLLVVAEVALALVLLAGAGLLVRTLANLNAADPGFRGDDTLVASLSLPSARYRNWPDVRGFHQRLAEGLASLPGVERVGVSTTPPFTSNWTKLYSAEGITKPGDPPARPHPPRHRGRGLTFAVAAVLLLATGLLATYFPARRAAAVDPMVALRQE